MVFSPFCVVEFLSLKNKGFTVVGAPFFWGFVFIPSANHATKFGHHDINIRRQNRSHFFCVTAC